LNKVIAPAQKKHVNRSVRRILDLPSRRKMAKVQAGTRVGCRSPLLSRDQSSKFTFRHLYDQAAIRAKKRHILTRVYPFTLLDLVFYLLQQTIHILDLPTFLGKMPILPISMPHMNANNLLSGEVSPPEVLGGFSVRTPQG
jgi:hypothetical protein